MMTTELLPIREASDFEPLVRHWDDLLLASGGTVFDTPAWILANLESFPPARAEILVVRDRGVVVGIVPIAVRRGRRDLTSRSWGELASLPHADYGSLLSMEDAAPEVATAIIEYFLRNRDISALHLGHLPRAWTLTRSLPHEARQHGLRPLTQEGYWIRRLPLSAASLADRPSLNKRYRQLARLGDVQFRAFTGRREVLDNLEVFFALHARRFNAKGATSPLQDPLMRQFYAAIVNRLGANRGVLLSSLDLDGTPVAMRFSLQFAGTLHLYAAAFDPTLGRYSPGILQLRHLVEYGRSAGLTTLDLGIGDTQHKQLFSEASTTQLLNLGVFRTALNIAEAKSARWVRTVSAQHPLVAQWASRVRELLPARQPM